MKYLEDLMKNLIDEKYEKVFCDDVNGCFDKIVYFEANAIGQLGEEFIKGIFEDNNMTIDNENGVVHDEYDVLIKDTKIEIKTARKGKNNTFQFNGINPRYNHDFIILLGLSVNEIYYRIVKKTDITYQHSDRSYNCKIGNKTFKLVCMNPGNDVSRKLTLNIKYLQKADENLINELKQIYISAKE